jgi:hypothetical protein
VAIQDQVDILDILVSAAILVTQAYPVTVDTPDQADIAGTVGYQDTVDIPARADTVDTPVSVGIQDTVEVASLVTVDFLALHQQVDIPATQGSVAIRGIAESPDTVDIPE